MFRLVKIMLLFAGLAALAFIVFKVELGDRTLYQHLVGISRTEEARSLGNELEKKAGEVVEEVRHKVPALISGGTGPASAADAAPLADITREDRDALDDLLRTRKAAKQQ